MNKIKRGLLKFVNSPFFPYFVIVSIICGIYYKFFLLGKIPFPGDLLVVSYAPWFDYYKFPVQNPIISDVFSQLFLWKYLSIDSFRALQWPLWNPYSFSGNPLLATYQSATLYPLNILLLLPKYFGWGLFIFSQTLIAALGMYLLLSIWLSSRLASLTGAVIFAFGGLMTTWLELGTAVHTIAWLPISLYFIERYWTNFRLRYLLLLTSSLILLTLAGHVQIVTFSFIILFVFIFINSLSKDIKTFATCFFPPLISLGLSLLITAPQLLPSLDLLNKSIRFTESYTGSFNFGLLPFKDVLKFLVADFFGNPITRNYWGFLNYVETTGFVGSLTLPLLLFAYIYLKRNKVSIFFLALLPVSLILTFDNYISQTIYSAKIPFLTSSYASRMLFITTFSISVLSAFAIDQIIKDRIGEKKIFKLAVFSWASFVGVLAGSILTHQIIQNIIQSVSGKTHLKFYLDFYLRDPDFSLPNFIVAARNSFLPILLISVFLIFFIVISNIRLKFIQKYRITLICFGLFILIAFDLGRYFLKFNPFVAQEFIFPEVPALHYLQTQPGIFRVGRDHAEVLPPNTWIAYNLQSIEGYDPLYLNQYGKVINFINGGDIRYDGVSRYAELTNYKSTFLDAANTKYFIGIGRDKNGIIPGNLINYKFEEAKFKRVFSDKSAVILENPNAMDRVYFAQSFRIASRAQTEDIIMTDPKFDPKHEVAISKDLQISSVTGKGTAIITSYTSNIVKIKTKTQSEEILVLADQYEEGWHAKIDGKEALISPANLIFRAIKIPAGEHEVIFNYYPKSFDIGLKISLVTLGSVALLSFLAMKKKQF